MKKDNYLSEYASVIEFLDRLGVYDIRNIAREVGVPSPTTEKKGDLIRAIVEVESGQKAPEGKRTNKGAPTKGGKISEGLLSQIRKMIISAVLARAAVVSGGREVLMSRVAERCFFLD